MKSVLRKAEGDLRQMRKGRHRHRRADTEMQAETGGTSATSQGMPGTEKLEEEEFFPKVSRGSMALLGLDFRLCPPEL